MVRFQFEIKNPKIISTNDAYYHPVRKCKDGRYRSYVCKSESLKKFQEFYKEELPKLLPEDEVKSLKSFIEEDGTYGIELVLEYGIPTSQIREHDASNFVKAMEDCIVSYTGIDDCHHIRVVVEKESFDNFTEDWMLKVTLGTYKIKKYETLTD